ncbi:MAG TPA: sigma-54 dependent transcriptional regulator, partial [Thermoanaerobaculia bacterium]|nr:sigma-54 dependent transcriptional regulator [Thermoanaerobaculia bacterium]
MSDIAHRVFSLSMEEWGERRAIEMVGSAPGFLSLLAKTEKVASFDEPVLIIGESGSGKEAVAQAIYLLGPRRGKPYVSVNCPQYQEGNLTVSELFGHKKGSFTGASADRKGCFETANGGVIFLDEIADLHMSAQVMLLRALARGEFQPVGSETTKSVNVRVVAATNRPLDQLVSREAFRHDLYFRLRYFLIEVPSLRSRGDDWQLLVHHFLGRLRARYGVVKSVSADALRILGAYSWPGNVRELTSVVTTAYALCDGDVIQAQDVISALGHGEETPDEPRVGDLYRRIVMGGESFWQTVGNPFLDREISRNTAK